MDGRAGHRPEEIAARERAAERLLRERGIEGARVNAVGHDRSVAAVVAPADALARLADHAGEIKALGFRYVALDLTAVAEAEGRG